MRCIHTCIGFLVSVLGCVLCHPFNNTTGQECSDNNDCNSGNTCVDLKCVDPCLGVCGINTTCFVEDALPVCSCKPGYEGDPFTNCTGVNAECTQNAQCSLDKACVNLRCVDPCQDACGLNSVCKVVNRRPMCACLRGFVYRPDSGCKPVSVPECQTNSHCPKDRSCRQQKCMDPCEEGVCGNNTVCSVKNHFPICACEIGFVGDAFNECMPSCSLVASPPDIIGVPRRTGDSIDENVKSYNRTKTLYISDIDTTWYSALRACYSRGMNMSTVNDEDEWNNLAMAIKAKHNSPVVVWLGGHDLGRPKHFVWISTGEKLSYNKWAIGEPTAGDYHCLLVNSNHQWISAKCFSNYYFACESR